MVIHKDPASWIMFCLLRNQITCHSVKGERISFPSARSPSRQGSGLGSTRKRVAIYWHLDLRVLRVGLWVNSCCCWMGSVWRDKAQERERVQPCNVCEKAFKFCQRLNRPKFGRKVAIFCLQGLWQEVQAQQKYQHTQEACEWQASPQEELLQLLHVRHYEIILNLNIMWEEEIKRTVLASSRKRANILYHLNCKSFELVFNKFVV